MTTLTKDEADNLGILDYCAQLRASGQLGERALALLANVEAAERDYLALEAAYAATTKPVTP